MPNLDHPIPRTAASSSLSMNRWNHRQVLDCGDEVCVVAALDLKPARSGWTEALESSYAKAVNRYTDKYSLNDQPIFFDPIFLTVSFYRVSDLGLRLQQNGYWPRRKRACYWWSSSQKNVGRKIKKRESFHSCP
jgi:hypothetical protein